jgi:pimeloyl-ACP methyl ester carboxylesterase
LSALLAEPPRAEPRATVIALHGAGMSAGYFDGQAHPDVSLLALGASLGYTVLALDRPGYGESAALRPDGALLADQATLVTEAMRAFAKDHRTGAGMFLLAHSYGGKLALTVAAGDGGDDIIGLDISGCGRQYAVAPADLHSALAANRPSLNWGPLWLYPPDTFRASATVVAPMPTAERDEGPSWPRMYPAVAARVTVAVRFTFAEHEAWWQVDDTALAALREPLAARCVRVDRQPAAGHNISLGWAARPYHLRALAFLEECMRCQVS